MTVLIVLTDDGREPCGTNNHRYELYLQFHDIEHRNTRVQWPQINGFVERFNLTVQDEFVCTALRTAFYESVEQLQVDRD